MRITKNKIALLCLIGGLFLILIGYFFMTVKNNERQLSRDSSEERFSQLRELIVLYNSLDEDTRREEGFDFFQVARDQGVLWEHPLAIKGSNGSYTLLDERSTSSVIIVENENIDAVHRYGIFLDGRIDVVEND